MFGIENGHFCDATEHGSAASTDINRTAQTAAVAARYSNALAVNSERAGTRNRRIGRMRPKHSMRACTYEMKRI